MKMDFPQSNFLLTKQPIRPRSLLILADGGVSNGLHIEACRDQRTYQKGIKVSDKEMRTIALIKSDVLGKWNYTIVPKVRSVCMQSSIDTEATISIHQTRQSARKTKCSWHK